MILLTAPRRCFFCISSFVIYVSRVSLLCCHVYVLQPYDYLMGKGLLTLLCVMFSYVLTLLGSGMVLECTNSRALPSSLPCTSTTVRTCIYGDLAFDLYIGHRL